MGIEFGGQRFFDCVLKFNSLKVELEEQYQKVNTSTVEVNAFKQGVAKLEANIVLYQKGQQNYEEKIRILTLQMRENDVAIQAFEKQLLKVAADNEVLKASLYNEREVIKHWQNSSKGIGKLINSQMGYYEKTGLGYIKEQHGITLTEKDLSKTIFEGSSDSENVPKNDRYAERMKVVPPPLSGIHMPPNNDSSVELDESKSVYGKRTNNIDHTDCNSDSSTLTQGEPIVTKKVVYPPLMSTFVPEGHVPIPSSASKQVKTPRKAMDSNAKHHGSIKRGGLGLNARTNLPFGSSLKRKGCFVCGSLTHFIKDCTVHDDKIAKLKVAKKVTIKHDKSVQNKSTQEKGNKKPQWENAQRVNKQK
ncbi:hypothetical protein Tco_0614783 [Tanacetum coccineum]